MIPRPTDELQHIITKSRDAKRGCFGVLSTSEKLAAALVLNRADWLAEMPYTLAEAIERVGPKWLALIPKQRGCWNTKTSRPRVRHESARSARFAGCTHLSARQHAGTGLGPLSRPAQQPITFLASTARKHQALAPIARNTYVSSLIFSPTRS